MRFGKDRAELAAVDTMKGRSACGFSSRIRRFNAHDGDYGELYDIHTVAF